MIVKVGGQMRLWLALWLLTICVETPLEARISPAERQTIDKVLGSTGEYVAAEDTYKFVFPSGDMKVVVQGREIPSFMGLESWVAFVSDPHHGGRLLVAELCLLEDEVNPVLSAALDNGLAITGIADSYMFEEPRILSMHISGLGDSVDLATKLQRLRQIIKSIRTAHPKGREKVAEDGVALKNDLDASELDSILMTHGQSVHGMYKASMGMVGTIFGVPAGKQLGLRTWIAFAGTSQNAVTDGQIIMTPDQVHNVLRALRERGMYVTALHNHFIDSNPEFYFVHFWGNGRAEVLAQSIRQVLQTQMK